MEKKKDCYVLIPNESKNDVKNKFADIIANEIIGKTDAENERKMTFELFCKHYDLYFDEKIMSNCDDIGRYISKIGSLPQYRGLKFKDSKFDNDKKNALIEALKYDQEQLLKKRIKCLENNDIGTYKNIVNALTVVTGLIHEEERNISASVNKSVIKEIIEDKIDNYIIQKEGKDVDIHTHYYKPTPKELYFDYGINSSTISFNGNIYTFKEVKCNEIAKKISELIKGENVNVYGDTRGMGMVLSDCLLLQYGIKTNNTIVNSYTDVNDPKGQYHTVCNGN